MLLLRRCLRWRSASPAPCRRIGPTCTGAPGAKMRATPSTITWSPAFRPDCDDPVVAGPVADLHRARLGLALGADDVDELALRAFQHRALRHRDRVRAHARPSASRARTGPGAARPSGLGISARVSLVPVAPETRTSEKFSLPVLRVDAAVGELHRHLEAAVLRQLQAAGRAARCRCAAARCPAMPKITYIGSICVTVVSSTSGPGDQRALGALRAAGDAGDRRLDPRVAQVQLRLGAGAPAPPSGRPRAIASAETASSYSFWLTALSAYSGFRRAAFLLRLREARLGAPRRRPRRAPPRRRTAPDRW